MLLGESSQEGFGGMFRSDKFSGELSIMDFNKAEVHAILRGIKICKYNFLRLICIEGCSKLVGTRAAANSACSWRFIHICEELKDAYFLHTPRSVNDCAGLPATPV